MRGSGHEDDGFIKIEGGVSEKKNKYFFMWVNSLSVGEFDSDFFASTTDDKENSRDEENRFEKDQLSICYNSKPRPFVGQRMRFNWLVRGYCIFSGD